MAVKEHGVDATQCKSLAFFKSLTLFINLPDEEIMRFADAAQIKNYKKGQMLYSEDEKASFFYIVCDGWLKLFHTTEEGEIVVLAMLTKDNITGKNALFEEGRFTHSALVAEDAEVLAIPLSLLKERLRANNQLALNMISSMVQHQRRHELQLEQHFLYSAPQRIACFLMGLCPTPDQKDGVTLTLPYEKVLIASALGMKGETFSRALNILREETGIHIIGARVTIDSMERLRKFADGCFSPPMCSE